ncbi:hypothetical protein [Legionella cardiaca]|uniref:Dot/Icm T4SS effector n=1 Tax=Legionella cardiaca TaxID=1071983 RepID=A0ABY8AMK9_9GAMM|nr:hypothetical protein [Legionella cardiaca]WED41929.1 hypothetical protein PXX05_08265 [Legionella cardiaca]
MMPLTVLLDVDETLRMKTTETTEDGQRVYELNQALLDQLKMHAVTEINLFTNMTLTDISSSDQEEEHITRAFLIRKLEEQGFKVNLVMTPADVGYQKGLGAAYRDIYVPTYEQYNAATKWQDKEAIIRKNSPEYAKHGEAIYDEESRKLQTEEKAGYQKAKLFEYFIQENKKNNVDIGTVLYFDDDPVCLKWVAEVAAREGIKLVTNQVDPTKIEESGKAIREASLIANVHKAVNGYKTHTQGIIFSFFHRHGSTGVNRAQDFVDSLAKIVDPIQQQQAIVNYLSNSKNGNTHPHSFRTMLLATLIGKEHSNKDLKEVSKNFHNLLANYKNSTIDHSVEQQKDLKTKIATLRDEEQKQQVTSTVTKIM